MKVKDLQILLNRLPPNMDIYTFNGNECLSPLRTIKLVKRKDRLTMDFEDGCAPKGDFLETMP